MLHHYTEFMDNELIASADRHVSELITDYENIENETFTYYSKTETAAAAASAMKHSESEKAKTTQTQSHRSLFPAF
jgi:hypothetical protein